MKTLDAGFAAHIAEGVTTLAWCWRLERKDGAVKGFTDHDEDVPFGGVTYKAASGFSASQIQSGLGLSIDNLDVNAALSDDDLTEADLAAGLYDDAEIQVWRVNWADPAQRVLIRKGNLGEVKRGKAAFEAEIRGLAQKLTASVGRTYAVPCDADIGDARCGINLNSAAYKETGTVTSAIDGRRFSASGLSSYSNGRFGGGKVTWLTGANAGRAMEVKRHLQTTTGASIELWHAMSETIAVGDTFTVTTGCDKLFATCKGFGNGANHRGFPHIVGNDVIAAYPTSNQAMDGKSRYGN